MARLKIIVYEGGPQKKKKVVIIGNKHFDGLGGVLVP